MRLPKPELEKRVFEKFIKHLGTNVIRFHSCDPPQPDICCDAEGGKLYFELTDNTSEESQKSVHAKAETSRNTAYWFEPFPQTYTQKFEKHYETESADCELVIYFGTHPVCDLGQHFDSRLHENIEWIQANMKQSQFRKVWIYDYHRDRVLACINKSN
jgi:hypothetical protein